MSNSLAAQLNLDKTTLPLHPAKTSRFLSGQTVGPITVEISPTNVCNQRCVFCAFDYARGKRHMSDELLMRVARQLSQPGIDAPAGVTWGGEGEPCLHPMLAQAMTTLHQAGVANGLTTNGSRPVVKGLLPFLAWVRFSVNAATPKLYGTIHGVSPTELKKVLETIEYCVNAKKEHNHRVILGIQALLFDENEEDVLNLCKLARQIGVDYFTVKPYSRHPTSTHAQNFSFDPTRLGPLEKRLMSISTEAFAVILREAAFVAKGMAKPYDHCLAASFFHFIDHRGEIYPCAQFVGQEPMRLGSLGVQTWPEFLASTCRHDLLYYLANMHECSSCRHPCRLHEANLYLERVLNPLSNDGFI